MERFVEQILKLSAKEDGIKPLKELLSKEDSSIAKSGHLEELLGSYLDPANHSLAYGWLL